MRIPPASVLLLVLLLMVSAGSCSRPAAAPLRERPEETQRPEGEVVIKEASRAFITVELVSTASSAALVQAPARVAFREGALSQVGAPVAGKVVKVHARTGDKVTKGAPLATLECPEAPAMRTARATATAALREASVSFERQRRMMEQGVGTEREKFEAETKLAQAKAELARADAAAALLGEGRGATVVLRSPIAGTVISWRATVGTAVQPGGDPLVEVGNPTALWIVADVFERDLAHVHEGARALVTVSASGTVLTGKVASVGASIASGLRTAPVRIVLERDEVPLRAGMFGRARIESPERGMTIPTSAVLIRDGKETVVYVEKNRTTFIRKAVTVAQPHQGRVLVLGGVSPGERIVTKGALLLDGVADQLL